jgi:hypothetical protein
MSPPSEICELPPKPSGCPTAIGAISIVFGSLGLVCYGCVSLNTLATPFRVGMVPEDQRPPTPQGLQLFAQIFQMCAAFGLSLWLLIAGIGLTRRRAWSRAHSIGWSVAKILLTVISTATGMLFVGDSVDQINSQLSQNGTVTPPFTVGPALFTVFIMISALWAILWPVFLLIWFSRGAVKDEVAAWEEESRAMI